MSVSGFESVHKLILIKALKNKFVNSNSFSLNLVKYISRLFNASSSVTVKICSISIDHSGLDDQKQMMAKRKHFLKKVANSFY